MSVSVYIEYIESVIPLIFCVCIPFVNGIGEVIYAVNCGGETHTDVNGIRYQKDPYPQGISSDYGKNLLIQRVPPQDQLLYQTEKYDTSSFSLDIPIKPDGNYVLVLKFSEVWFTAANQKVFDVVLNRQHVIVDQLDIFSRVGRGFAHDEIIPFSIKSGVLTVEGDTSRISGKLSLEFQKSDKDNPKINAFYIMRGTLQGLSAHEYGSSIITIETKSGIKVKFYIHNLSNVPQLPPMPGFDKHHQEEEEFDDDVDEEISSRKKRPNSGPKIQDPYAHDDASSALLPVFIAVGAFVPLLFCLCKL